MNDPIRTPAEALEAAAQEADSLASQVADAALTGLPEQARLRESMESAFTKAAVRIRALSSRIPPAPDDEALVERCAKAMNSAWCPAPEGTPDWRLYWSEHRTQYRKQARAALREAGALR